MVEWSVYYNLYFKQEKSNVDQIFKSKTYFFSQELMPSTGRIAL